MKTSLTLLTLLLFFCNSSILAQNKNLPKFGKYNCTASKYVNGFYEYTPRGSFVIAKNGTYTYNGFKKPSKGTFNIDAKGNLSFNGGYLSKGKAEKFEGQNRFWLVFPSIPDNRWTCTCEEK
jgi:hypothetical protein